MQKTKPNVLLISSQPIQNAASLQEMAHDTRVRVRTAYCTLPDASLYQDSEHLNKAAFDLPMLDGYDWVPVKNYSPLPRLGKFYGLINPGLIRLVAQSDCCIIYGHSYISFWMAIATAKLLRKPILLSTDATSPQSHYGASNWKSSLKKKVFPFLYNHVADGVLVPSTASKQFLCSMGVYEDRVALTPYVVDNQTIATISAATDRQELRRQWQIPVDATVAVFCAKFLPRKRPQDAIQAFARADVPNSYLMMVGEGPMGDSLRDEAERLGIKERVRFVGLVKYSHLPEVYTASDVLVFPSEHEPYGLPVNEAMICGIPTIVSDRIGAGLDLVENDRTGFVYPSGEVKALADILRKVLSDRERLKSMGEAARQRIATWSPRDNADATIRAVEKALAARGSGGLLETT
jgi:glycosyltransferase involved in cell wall biosynthesis